MSKVDIKILNSYYNNKSRIEYDSFNSRTKRKREARLSKISKKPLTEREKFLYERENLFKDPIVNCDGFYKLNDMSHILFTLTKTQLDIFYEETKILNSKCPTKNFIGTTIMDERNKNSFLSITNPKSFGMLHISEIEPNDPKLSKYVKTIYIYAFGISHDSVCVDFQVFYTTTFLNQFNECLTDYFETAIEYKKVYINGKTSVSHCYPIPETSRAQYADDVLFEIKSRVETFLRKNYSMFGLQEEPLTSIDEYRTNLARDNRFINCFGYNSLSEKELLDYTYSSSKGMSKNGQLLLDYREIIKHPFYDLHRGRMLFIVADDEYTYIQQSLSFILMFFVQKNEIDKYDDTLNQKYALFERIGKNKYWSISSIFRKYAFLCLRASNSQVLLDFSKLKIFPYISNDAYLKSLIEYIKEEGDQLDARNNALDTKINNILASKNNAVSIVVAIIALIVSSLSTIAAIATIIMSFFIKG